MNAIFSQFKSFVSILPKPSLQTKIASKVFAKSYASFPIVKDPDAIEISFKKKVNVTSWKLDTPLELKEHKKLIAQTVERNRDRELVDIFVKKFWFINSFDKKNYPTVVGEIKNKKAFSSRSDKYLLFMDMPIKLVGKGWQIPNELAPYREVIKKRADFEKTINPYFNGCNVYITIDQRPVKPNESQRRPGWHVDSFINKETNENEVKAYKFIETDSIYLVSDSIPTQFCPGPFSFGKLNPNDTEKVLQHFETLAKDKEIITYAPYTLVRMGPECVHQVGFNKTNKTINRTFVKITYSQNILNRQGNGLNPLFDVNWPMYPRNADKRNHVNIIGDYFPDSADYQLLNDMQLRNLFKKNPKKAVKVASINAILATPGEILQTSYKGFATTVNIAKVGDWKVTSPCGDQYFLSSETMQKIYRPGKNGTFIPKDSEVFFVKITEKIKLLAPWGSLQFLRPGDFLVKRQGEIYGILHDDFVNAYTLLD